MSGPKKFHLFPPIDSSTNIRQIRRIYYTGILPTYCFNLQYIISIIITHDSAGLSSTQYTHKKLHANLKNVFFKHKFTCSNYVCQVQVARACWTNNKMHKVTLFITVKVWYLYYINIKYNSTRHNITVRHATPISDSHKCTPEMNLFYYNNMMYIVYTCITRVIL